MSSTQTTLGGYIGVRLQELGIKHYFAIPGDYNLVLLDELLKNQQLKLIHCCNELNAGYAADGYCRAHGLAALAVTYSVGGLSLINAVAGAYAEDLPIIVLSGAPNTNSRVQNQLLHHTLGKVDYDYVRKMFEPVTAYAVTIRHLSDASYQIDKALEKAVISKKPVYIEVACNLAGLALPLPCPRNFPAKKESDPESLKAAVRHAADFLNSATKPVLVAGSQLRSWGAVKAFCTLAQKCEYAVASMPDAKGLFEETHKSYIGTYWGPVSTPACGDIVQSSDAYLFAGPRFTDYTTTGGSALILPKKLISAHPHHVTIVGKTYTNVALDDFLLGLSKKLKKNSTSLIAYNRIKGGSPLPKCDKTSKNPLTTRVLFARIQQMLTKDMALVVETGDSWFNSMRLRLPEGCRYEIQMQYGSIGWSVPATMGYELGSPVKKRPVAFIGDGSFQMTAQELSTIIRYNLKPIFFLINNGGYTIEVEIHDGPYNIINNWNYTKLVDVFNGTKGAGLGFLVKTEGDLERAITKAEKNNGACLIECVIDRDDCNKNLLMWGSHVANNNARMA